MAHIGPKENELSYIFMKKENKFSCLFGHNIISNCLYKAIRKHIVAKKTTELVKDVFFIVMLSKLLGSKMPILEDYLKQVYTINTERYIQ